MSQIRRSQFLTTYGPGAILEGVNGPRIILSPELAGVFQGDPTRFEITDQRLSQGMLDGAGILRLPSNAELGVPETKYIYKTKRFPSWSLCTRHNTLYQKTTHDEKACPHCPPLKDSWEAWREASRQAIRFVRACPAGHLDDVDWAGIIQHLQPNCHPSWLRWYGSGALKNITIECPLCHARINLGVAYSQDWFCSGRSPEKESEGTGTPRPGCSEKARIIQRGAANLRIAEIETALVIPKCDTNLHRLLQISAIRNPLEYSGVPANIQTFFAGLAKLVQSKSITQATLAEIARYDEQEILTAIRETLNERIPHSAYELRRDEFHALLDAATYGHPPERPKHPGDVPNFEINQHEVLTVNLHGKMCLRITPVSRLRVIMVQRGYRRIPAGQINAAQVVDAAFTLPFDPGRKWYIGSELSGEGIFIDLDIAHAPQNRLLLNGPVTDRWMHAWLNPQDYIGNSLIANNHHQYHPAFVWWHTFAHRLINALAVDSGYSSAAIRERIYLDVDEKTGEADGGLLLYTAQPGGDGTLGGLIALVPEFKRVLERALHNVDLCSNDPLCGEEQFSPGKYNGAACYACLLISETSCEHRNMCLDRNLLLESLP